MKRKHTKRRTRPAKGMPTPASQRRRANKNRVQAFEKSVAVLGAVETLLQHGHTTPALSVLIDVLKSPVEFEEFSKSMVRMPQ